MTNSAQSDQQPLDPNWAPTPRAHAQYSRPSSSGGSKPVVAKEGEQNKQDRDKEEGEEEEEEEDEYEKRIERTGCSAENEALQLCYAEKHDWRACQDAMNAFKDCWKRNGNIEAEV
ncbi:hypothetical protein EDD11_007703 [Mortierella claussenii]|nr:hypothetical protein EDD11_007703 [Mortierella claussenii]